MPKELHDKLERQGRKKGLKGEALARYVYGTMQKIENEKARKQKGR